MIRFSNFIPAGAFSLLAAFCLSLSAEAESKPLKQAPNSVVSIPDSRNRIIKLTDKGIVPAQITMKQEDSIVFFVNDTSGSLTTLEIDFGKKPSHCGSGRLITTDDGKVRSVRPFGPNDFSSTCFHEKGDYPFKVFGLKSNPKGVESVIHVQ